MLSRLVYKTQQRICESFGVHFLGLNEVEEMTEKLAEQVRSTDFQPDLVFGILRGGYFPSKQIAKILNVPAALIDVSRPRSFLDNFILVHKLTGKSRIQPQLNSGVPSLNGYHSILLVDDDCGTGATFDVASQAISQQDDIEIKRAALVCYEGRYRPDFFAQENAPLNRLVRSRTRFPWLPSSPYYENYRREIAQPTELRKQTTVLATNTQ
jgi:hypoxanthine phosphoribosyltransferase